MKAKGCCTEWEQEIILYLDNELPSDRCTHVEKHLERCHHCSDFYFDVEREERLLAGSLRQETKPALNSLAFVNQVMSDLPLVQPVTLSWRLREMSLTATRILFQQGYRHYAIAVSILICVLGIYATLSMGNIGELPLVHIKRSGILYSSILRQPFYIDKAIRPEGEFFEFHDNTVVYASPYTLFSVEAYPENEEKDSVGMERRIRLQSGELFFDVKHRNEGFSVICPNAMVKVVGTQFYVSVTSGQTKITSVAVRKGNVLIETTGRSASVIAGQMVRLWSMNNGKKLVLQVPEPIRPDYLHRLNEFNDTLSNRHDQRILLPPRSLYDYNWESGDDIMISPFLTNPEY